jgi:MFS family permease
MASPAFRRLFAARTVSQWGDTFNSVALVILVYRLTGSGVKVAVTVAFEIVPVLALGFIAGAVVDRASRRRVMIAADLGRALIAVALAVLPHELAVVYAAAFGMSALSVFFSPAAASVLPTLVERRDVVGANSAVWSTAVISQIALAPLAGGLVAFAGVSPAFLVNAASFAVSAGLLAGLEIPSHPPSAASRHLTDVVEGLRTIAHDRFLSVFAAVQGLAALSAGATSALLVVLAEQHLDVGASQFGFMLAAIGIGAGLGPLVLQRRVQDVNRRRYLFGPYLLRGIVDVVMAASSSLGVALGALGLYGRGTSTGNVAYTTVLQTTVPDRLRGRVLASTTWSGRRRVSSVSAWAACWLTNSESGLYTSSAARS